MTDDELDDLILETHGLADDREAALLLDDSLLLDDADVLDA